MGAPLREAVVDVALSVLDQTPPNTAGPIGRLTSLINGQVTKYLAATATPGVATGARVKIEQREAFRALTTTVRSSVDGSVITPPWGSAELLDSLDDQLVSINDSIPRVKSGASFTGYPNSRVVTRKLQQSVMHTVNGVIQAQGQSYANGITCAVWTQLVGLTTQAWVGFKATNGAWVVPPVLLYTSTANVVTNIKTKSDGVNFFVFYTKGTEQFVLNVYDQSGAQLGTTTFSVNAGTTNRYSYWDATPAVNAGGYTILFAQPTTIGADVGVTFTAFGWNGSAIISTSNTDNTIHCDTGVSFIKNPLGNGKQYLGTVVTSGGTGGVWVYEITGLAQTHSYNGGLSTGTGGLPDSLIGWTVQGGGGVDVMLTMSRLTNSTQATAGPQFDPRYRSMTTYKITRADVLTTVKVENSVVAVSEAFQMDDDWYAVSYYQGGPGIAPVATTAAITWTAGDFMKGAPVQPLAFSPGDFQYGNSIVPVRNPADKVAIGLNVAYFINTVPPALAVLSTAQFAQVYQSGATITISGASNSGNNGTFPISAIGVAGSQLQVSSPAGGGQVAETFGPSVVITILPSHGTISPYPDLRNIWSITSATIFPDVSWIGENLFVTGTSQAQNWGANAITGAGSAGGGLSLIKLGNTVDMQPEYIPNPVQPTAVIQLQLADPTTAYEFFLQSATFDQSYVGAFLSVGASGILQNNGVYQIVQVIDATHVIATPVNGQTNQVNRAFQSFVKINVSFPTQQSTSLQQTWFITPLAIPTQHTVGRFEYGVAYADWRFDGNSFDTQNRFPLNVTPVVLTTNGDLQILLPYRAESFSAGVTTATGNPVDTAFATIGVKAFTITHDFGQSLVVGGELIIPGPQASEFTASGFAEQGINLGPEMPFFVSQSADGTIPIGLTPGTIYQYRVTYEFTDEDGDRIFTPPSPALNVHLSITNNTVTLGGNTLQPSQRAVTICIYRTSVAGGSPTVIRYKITNDTDPNGTGFTFPDAVTWNFQDQRPDSEILVSEQLYTDKGFKPRYPCPAFIQGVGTWRNRTWVIGYDGAIWMSGEKTEGDAVWFSPDYRYTLPTDDEPTCLAAMDDYLVVLAAMSNWYIPAVQFPDATGNNGQIPAPVQLPFANGCTGYAVTTRDGVIYSSTAGGIWLIPRNLTNGWLSQAIQQSLGLAAITGLAVDQNQRVLVSLTSTSAFVWDTIPGAWYKWNLPSSTRQVSTWQGNFVYSDDSRIMQHTPGSYADNLGASDIAIPPSWTLAPLHFMGSVRGYGRCWAFQLQGEYLGPHFMNLTLGYGDEVDYQPSTVFPPFPASPALSYLYEWNPKEEEASQFELSFAVTFPVGVAGNSATWELLSFDVGVDQGIARVASQKRISSGT